MPAIQAPCKTRGMAWCSYLHHEEPPPPVLPPQATIKVPLDAFKMDFIFSDVESGDGTYDSRCNIST